MSRWMNRRRQSQTDKDLRLLKRYSLGDREAFDELKKRYFACPPDERAESMKEIARYARATAALVNREIEAQSKKN